MRAIVATDASRIESVADQNSGLPCLRSETWGTLDSCLILEKDIRAAARLK